MNKLHILFFALLFAQSLSAQDFSEPKIGKISQEEIDMKTCSFDSTACAVVLFDTGESRFKANYDGFKIYFKRHKRIKIFTKQGFSYGEVTIPFYTKINSERVSSIEAYTYVVENGKLQKYKLDPSNIYTEVINDSWKQKKFVFPNLKEGAIIEYSYKLETPHFFNLPDWTFQSSIPTVYSQYQVGMVPYFEYVHLVQGLVDSLYTYKVEEGHDDYTLRGINYKEMTHSYIMKNLEGFKDESYITSKNDYLSKIDFQISKVNYMDGSWKTIIPTWKKLNSDLLESEGFGKYINGCQRFAEMALEGIDTTSQTKEEKVKKLVNYVKESFSWNKYNSADAMQSAKDFYTKKTGNAAEINLFLLALLRKAGINAEPMIISTRKHGKLFLQYPIIERFNYVLVYIDEPKLNIITDATSRLIGYSMVPPQCINDNGLIVNKEKAEMWAQVQYNKPSLNFKSFDIYINPEQKTCEVSFINKSTLYEAYENRYNYENDTNTIKKAFESNFDKIYNVKTRNYDKSEMPYLVSFKAEKELSSINDYLLLEPFFNLPPSENMLKQEKRSYPVDMLYPQRYQYDVNINLPDGYAIDNIPTSTNIDDQLVLIKLNSVMDTVANRLKISADYRFKKAIYTPEDYAQLKARIDTIVETFKIELILKKKS